MKEPKFTPLAIEILKKRYLRKNDQGEIIETPLEMFKRVAQFVSSAEDAYGSDRQRAEASFLDMMVQLDFLPNSPTLMNAALENPQLAACFVLPIEDSLEHLFQTAEQSARIQVSGGGVGFAFSNICPNKAFVRGPGGLGGGPIAYMHLLDGVTQAVKQAGTQRGANMGVLKVDHPDIEEFINIKEKESFIFENFNLSVGITDKFMQKLELEEEFELISPSTQNSVRSVSAKNIFDSIVENAWKTGDPGVVYLDQINRYNPTPHLGDIEGTNPCGETPLLPFETCMLGSINLSNMIVDSKVSWSKLAQCVETAVRFLDDALDVTAHPLPQIEEMAKKNRKIGVGIMGWADALVKLQVPYNSEEAIQAADEIMEFINYYAKTTSVKLACERDRFTSFAKSLYATERTRMVSGSQNGVTSIFVDRPTLDWSQLLTEIKKHGIRNATVTTIAPTGSVSIIAGVSSGIEPIHSLVQTRRIMDKEVEIVHPLFEEFTNEMEFYDENLMHNIAKGHNLNELEAVPEILRSLFVTALEIAPEWDIKMQAAFQNHVDNAVSKTVNLQAEATREDIADIYLLAHQLGCKGITVYRDGCRKEQILTRGSSLSNDSVVTPRPVPRGRFPSVSYSVETPTGTMSLTIREYEQKPFDVFVILGRAGSDITAFTEAIGRLLSIALRSNIPVKILAENLEGLGGRRSVGLGPQRILSVPDAIGKILNEEYVKSGDSPRVGELCPACKNSSLAYSEGCMTCLVCGFSEC